MGKEYGGEGGIRTREKIAPLHDFQSCPFGRSGTSPTWREILPSGPGNSSRRETWDLRYYRQPPARLSTDSNFYSIPLPFKFARALLYNISARYTDARTP